MATSHETLCAVKTGAGTVSNAKGLYIIALTALDDASTLTIEGEDNITVGVGGVGAYVSFPSPIYTTSFISVANMSVIYYSSQ